MLVSFADGPAAGLELITDYGSHPQPPARMWIVVRDRLPIHVLPWDVGATTYRLDGVDHASSRARYVEQLRPSVVIEDGPRAGDVLVVDDPPPHRVAVSLARDEPTVTTFDDPGGVLYRLQPNDAGSPTYRLAHPTRRETGTGYGGVDEAAGHGAWISTW